MTSIASRLVACLVGTATVLAPSVLVVAPGTAAGSAAAVPSVQAGLLGSLENVKPLDPIAGAAGIVLRALPGEVESFQVVVRGGAQDLPGTSVAVGVLSGPGGATISGRSVSVYREAYTRIWTPSDQEGWCQYFTPGSHPYCGVPINGPKPAEPENVTWKCGGNVAPILDQRECLVPDALVPERDTFYDEDRNAFPVTVPAGENRMAWVDVAVPANAPAGRYTGAVTVSSTGATPVTRQVSVDVQSVALPAYGTDPVTDLLGGVNVNPTLCQAHGCSTGDEASYRLMSLYGRAGLENRMPILNPAPANPTAGAQRTLFDRWISPLLTGAAVVDPAGALLAPRLPGSHLREALLNQHTGAAGWKAWQTASRAAGFESNMRFYCDEVYADQATFEGECANPYDAAVGVGGWDTAAAPLRSSLIGNQRHQTLTEQWGATTPRGSYRVADAVRTRIPVANDLDQRNGTTTRASYDAPGGFLTTPDRDLWIYTSNSATGAGVGWTPHEFWNGWPGISGADQPPTSERAGPVMAWISRTTGHYYYDAFNKLPQAWNDCSVTPDACLYTFGSHGDGTLYYPGTTAQIGGQHPIPIESMRLKRYRDGAEDYALLQLLDTGCHGQCTNRTRTELLDVVGNPATRVGLFPFMYTTDKTDAAYAQARQTLLNMLPAVAASAPGAPSVTGSTPSSGAISVAFTPGADGGSAITGFTAQCVSTDGGVTRSKTGASSPIAVTLASGGKHYHCRVRATNAVGSGPYSAYGATVLVGATAPGAPTVTGSTASSGAISVAFTPGADGGSAITGFTALCVSTDGGTTRSKTGASSPISVTSLTNGKSYHCRVRATNAVGPGTYSAFGTTVLVTASTNRIAFTSNRDGDREIFTMGPDGSDVRQLTSNAVTDDFAAWSPDGTRIAFTRTLDVWVMNADGTGQTNLTHNPAGQPASKPAWSADGSKLVYVQRAAGETHTDLYLMNPDGSAKTPYVTYASGGIDSYDPSVSPADIAYFTQHDASGASLMRFGLDSTGFTAVTTGFTDEAVDVSPDGTRMTFSRSNAAGSAPYDVYTSDLSGGGLVNVTATLAGRSTRNDFQSSFSPTSSQLVFASDLGGDLEIWTASADGSTGTQLTSNTSSDSSPDWSP